MSFNAPDIRQFKLTGSTVGDVYFPKVAALLPFDGTNGATSTSDLSNRSEVLALLVQLKYLLRKVSSVDLAWY